MVSQEGGATREAVPGFAELGLLAFTTTRQAGTFGTQGSEPVHEVMGRWSALRESFGPDVGRLATAQQVHGNHVLVYEAGWAGWLRGPAADGHATRTAGTAMAVTIADCVPVFLAHPDGPVALLHSGWRGTESRIVERGLDAMQQLGANVDEIRMHLGPAICGRCYEVSAEVYGRLTGRSTDAPTPLDLRALIAAHATARGVRRITVSAWCTRCHNDRFYSHRAGDTGRQLGVLVLGNPGQIATWVDAP
jgi:YfiH family protein